MGGGLSRCGQKGASVSVLMPNSVTNIMEYAFSNCSSLTNVAFGSGWRKNSGLLEIGEFAFRGCTSLEQIKLPPSLETIGNNAFAGCPLTYIFIGDDLRNIGAYAFGNSPTLTNKPTHEVFM